MLPTTLLLHHFHSESVRTVEFCKEFQYCNLFCSSGYDGRICIFNLQSVLHSFPLYPTLPFETPIQFSLQRHQQHPLQETPVLGEDDSTLGYRKEETQNYLVVDANLSNHSSICTKIDVNVLPEMQEFSSRIHSTTFINGNELLATARNSFVALFDITKAQQKHVFRSLKGCEASDRSVARKITESIAAIVTTDGKGIILLDTISCSVIRMLPSVHERTIRDIRPLSSLESLLPISTATSQDVFLMTCSEDGCCKIIDLQGKVVYSYVRQSKILSCAIGSSQTNSLLALGGKILIILDPLKQNRVLNRFLHENGQQHPIWKVLFSHTNSYLYAAYDEGYIKRFKKEETEFKEECVIMYHRNDIEDCDLDITNQYLITASQDQSIGLTCLGKEMQIVGNFEDTSQVQ